MSARIFAVVIHKSNNLNLIRKSGSLYLSGSISNIEIPTRRYPTNNIINDHLNF